MGTTHGRRKDFFQEGPLGDFSKIFSGGAKVVKFAFSLSKLRKQSFFAEMFNPLPTHMQVPKVFRSRVIASQSNASLIASFIFKSYFHFSTYPPGLQPSCMFSICDTIPNQDRTGFVVKYMNNRRHKFAYLIIPNNTPLPQLRLQCRQALEYLDSRRSLPDPKKGFFVPYRDYFELQTG